jgi:predicted DNA-binding transcriptional regulator YafY
VAVSGRKQREPMERLIRLAMVLHHAGATGVDAQTLIEVAGFDGGDPRSALVREFKHLRDQGWQIENIAGRGQDGRYRMTTVDNRLGLKLSRGQRTALLRAVVLADRDDLAARLGLPEPEALPERYVAARGVTAGPLQSVLRAVRLRQVLRCRYGGRLRVVHPESVQTQHGSWYLGGREEGDDRVKWFEVSRMSDVVADRAESASPHPAPRHTGLHPMTWDFDPPVDVTLRAAAEFLPDVLRWLGEPRSRTEGEDGRVELVYRVTHRAALRCRLYELGRRIEVVGPDDVRAELIDELALMAGV